MIAEGVLAVAMVVVLGQSPVAPSQETVGLILGPEPVPIEIVTVTQAQREYEELSKLVTRTEAQDRRRMALNIALSTRSTPVRVPGQSGSPERTTWEIRRGVRRAAQVIP